jgi:UDP:flavonoid glycosyltransferase YjiC (YdhE family)
MSDADRRADAGSRTIVYVTSGIFGYLYRFFPIGRALRARGHHVVVVSPSAEAVAHARSEGFEARLLRRDQESLDEIERSGWPARWAPVLRRVPGVSLGPRSAARAEWARRAAILGAPRELSDLLADVDPAIVLTEAEEHRTIRVASAARREVIVFEDLYSTRPGPDVPFPARSHQIPDGSWRSRVRARARWERFFAAEAVRRSAERWWVDGNDLDSILGRLGEGAGLAEGPPRNIERRYLQFYDYRTVPRIRTVAPELAFPGEPQPPTVVGPIVDPDRLVHDVDPGFESRWAEALRRRSAGERIVYISLGTFLSGLVDLTRTVIEAAEGVPHTEIIVSVGRDHERWRGVDLGDRVSVFGRVPQTVVLADTDVVVSTGGLNTGHEALWFGVPVLNLPVAGLDTPGNAARIAYHGAGRRLVPGEISVETVRAEIAELLDDPSYASRSRELGRCLRTRNAIEAAVAVIESVGR